MKDHILIFIHVSAVIKPLILHTDASKTSFLQEQRFILDGSLLGNGLQQPRRYLSHMSKLVLEYWTVLQLSFHHLLTLYLIRGGVMVIYKLQSHIKQAWATTYHTRIRVVARDKDAPEHAFGWWSALNHLCGVETSLQRIGDTSSSIRLQFLASFGRVPAIALSIPELVVILKPSQVYTSIFRLRFSIFMRGETSLSRLKVSLFKTLGALSLAEDLRFMPYLEELWELH